MDRRPSKGQVPQKFRIPANPKANLLKPDVLDDETRQLLLEGVMRPVAYLPPSPSAAAKTGASASPQAPTACGRPSAQASSPRRASKASGQPSEACSGEGVHPAQLRAKVNANPNDLVTSMAARLSELEKRQKSYQSEISELQGKNRALNDKYQKEAKLREDAETLVVMLYDEKKELETQVGDMKKFLADYGMEWHGNENEAGGTGEDRASTPADARSKEKPFDLYEGDFKIEDSTVDKATEAQQPPSPARQLFSNGDGESRPSARRASHDTAPDVALLKKNARILSDYVGGKGVVTDGKRAVIRERDVVTVAVYKNGICVNKGAFRPYGWPFCEAFVKDLADGFYPYEFKEKYPEGFPIEVVDYSQEVCPAGPSAPSSSVQHSPNEERGSTPQSRQTASPAPLAGGTGAEGRRLGGPSTNGKAPYASGAKETAAVRARSHEGGGAGHVVSLQDGQRDKGYSPVPADQFLRRIPETRISPSGQVLHVRDGVAALLAGKDRRAGDRSADAAAPNDRALTTVRHVTAAEAAFRGKEAAHCATAGTSGPPAVTALRVGSLVAILVRLPSGLKVTLHMEPTASIADVRSELAAAVPDFVQKHKYELCQAFPDARTFTQHSQTLQDLGLTRTCTMMVRVIGTE